MTNEYNYFKKNKGFFFFKLEAKNYHWYYHHREGNLMYNCVNVLIDIILIHKDICKTITPVIILSTENVAFGT